MATSNNKSNKKETKSVRALFSVVCLCIISLGLIVYFSTNTKPKNNTVNQPTTIVETTEVQHAVTIKETTTAKPTTTKQTTTKPTTTKPVSMEQTDTNTPFKSFYKYPLGDAVVRGYSEELSFDDTMGDYRAHTAVDFVGKEDEGVVAINDGIVLSVTTDNMYGIVVEIDHGGKLVAKYCGLKSTTVKKGSYVTIGQKIGTLGKIPCEAKEKPHLHLETRLDKKIVNPLDAMSKTE